MSVKKTIKSCCVACLSVATGVVFADDSAPAWGVQDSFEGTLPVTLPAYWTGDANISGADAQYPYVSTVPTFGYPIPGASHANVLQVEGKAVCTNKSVATSVTASQVDFLVKVVAPDEAPDVAAETAGAQIAIAAWTNEVPTSLDTVPLKLFCKPRTGDDAATWVTLIDAVVTGTWVRVGLNFDYAQGVCRVSLNGSPLVTKEGYRTNAKNVNDTEGSWYQLANAPQAGNRVSEVKVIGTTQLDDFVITNASLEAYNPYVDAKGDPIKEEITPTEQGKTAVDVPLNVIEKSGLSKQEIAAGRNAPGDTLSVLDTVEAGLEVGQNQKFEMKTITPSVPSGSGDDKTQAFTITFPGSYNDGRYSVSVSTDEAGNSPLTVSDGTVNHEGSGNTWSGTVPVGSNKTIYFHLKAKQPTK